MSPLQIWHNTAKQGINMQQFTSIGIGDKQLNWFLLSAATLRSLTVWLKTSGPLGMYSLCLAGATICFHFWIGHQFTNQTLSLMNCVRHFKWRVLAFNVVALNFRISMSNPPPSYVPIVPDPEDFIVFMMPLLLKSKLSWFQCSIRLFASGDDWKAVCLRSQTRTLHCGYVHQESGCNYMQFSRSIRQLSLPWKQDIVVKPTPMILLMV